MHAASLFMWRDYFPTAEIIGLDIRTELLINQGRIRSYWCDQGDAIGMRKLAEILGGEFDLVIDDGVHEPEFQLKAMRAFLPFLAPHGMYVTEDVVNCDPSVLTDVALYRDHVASVCYGVDPYKMVVVERCT